MRIAITTLAVLVLTFGAFSLASGDDDQKAENKELVKMRAQIEALQLEVRYLRERESDVSGYILKNEARGQGLKAVVQKSRAAGFEANRIPVDSRKILLGGLEAAATSIGTGLPAVTKDQSDLLAKLAKFRKANGLNE